MRETIAMTSSEKTGPQGNSPALSSATDRSETTAKNMVVPLPEYLREINAVLLATEEAYSRGNLAECIASAEEGLKMLGLPLAQLCKAPIPPHYQHLFWCFRHLETFRAALSLYKKGLLHYRRTEGGAHERARQAWQLAWHELQSQFEGYDERLTRDGAHYDFPVAGRILRSVIRLREKLQECLQGTLPPS